VWKNRKIGDLFNFERWQIIGARLAGASVTKTATFLGVSRVTVSKVMSAYTNHGKTTSVKRNSGQKSALTERDRHTLRKWEGSFRKNAELPQHRWRDSRTEYSPRSPSSHKPNIHTSVRSVQYQHKIALAMRLFILPLTLLTSARTITATVAIITRVSQ
jgi:hypothetical protein